MFHPHPYKRASSSGDGLPAWPWRLCIVGPPGSGKRSAALSVIDRLRRWPDHIIVLHLDAEVSGPLEYSFADEHLRIDDIPEDLELDPQRRTLIIIDEVPWGAVPKATIAKLRTLFNFTSTHRNASIILQSQNYTAIPEHIRSACGWMVLTGKIPNAVTLGIIGTRVGAASGEIQELSDLLRSPFDSLSIDTTAPPATRYRLNLWTPIRAKA